MTNNDSSFRVGRRYRVAVEPEPIGRPIFGGCDVKLGDEFVCSHVDDDGDAWSADVTCLGAPAVNTKGWCVAAHDYIIIGYVVPVDDEVAG